MDEEKKEIVKAAKALSDFCDKTGCLNCPFMHWDGNCVLNEGETPAYWRIPNEQ